MSTDDVVDIAGDVTRPHRRQVWLRAGIPIGGVALVIAAVLAIALYSERANRSGVLLLSDDLLTTLQQRISQQVTAYLDPATRAARLARDMTARTTIADPRSALEAYAASALRQIPQIDAFYTGDAAGNFMMVQRGKAGGADTKTILNVPGPRLVEWTRRDAGGQVIGRERDPNDQFDPRTREWFQGALKSDDVYWTGVYVFFTRRTPGVTAAIRYHGNDGLDRVFGVDITLQALSDFLASLKIGRTGRAAIVDDTGHLIAAPDTAHMLRASGGQLTTARVDQINDPELAAAYDHFKVQGYGRRVIMVNDEPFVSIVSHLPASGRDWSLLMIAPEQDFTGFVARNGRRTLLLSLIVVALSTILAALLVRQGLRADRTARLLMERGRVIEQQNVAFSRLARLPDLFDKTQQAPVQEMTQSLVDLTGAQRASVWHLLESSQQLLCEDVYDRDSGGHSAGLRLTRAESPQMFAALESGEVIEAPDAASDRRTAELYRTLLHGSHSRSVFVAPVRVEDRTIGSIMLEDASHIADAHEFILLAADLIALRMRGAADSPATMRGDAVQLPESAMGERSLTAELVLQSLEGPLAAEVFASAAVMSIRFSDARALAARGAGSDTTLADRIAAIMQDVAAAHSIPYVKLLGHEVIAAAGLIADDTSAIVRIADAAIAIREHCLEQFEVCGHPPQFRIGIDCGVAIGSHVGRQPRMFNLWGEAVRTASRMAEAGAGPGTIQVSESAYRRLREQFLFRLRGRFYVPHAGAEQTFVLGGRQ